MFREPANMENKRHMESSVIAGAGKHERKRCEALRDWHTPRYARPSLGEGWGEGWGEGEGGTRLSKTQALPDTEGRMPDVR